MGLTVQKLELIDFRSYQHHTFELDPMLTVIHGRNGAGKTNVVEALQLLTEGTSFRTQNWADLTRWGGATARVHLEASGEGRLREVDLTIDGTRRTYLVNGKKVRSAAEVAGAIPCVTFTPNDLKLVQESAERRRDEVDALGGQLSKSYARLKAEYARVVVQRNRLLKDEVLDRAALAAWTERLVSVGAALTEHRVKLLARMRPHMTAADSAIHPEGLLDLSYDISSWLRPESQVSGEEFEAAYLATSREEREAAYAARLEERYADELARRVTLVGPHRDDVTFTIDGRSARSFGSQGQQRTVALAWKLAEVKTVQDVTGDSPILLLDDVMSELDEGRRRALTTAVGSVAQTVVTTANIAYFDADLLSRARVIEVGDSGEGE